MACLKILTDRLRIKLLGLHLHLDQLHLWHLLVQLRQLDRLLL